MTKCKTTKYKKWQNTNEHKIQNVIIKTRKNTNSIGCHQINTYVRIPTLDSLMLSCGKQILN